MKINFDLVCSSDSPTPEILEKEHLDVIEWELKNMQESIERVSRLLNEHRERTQYQSHMRFMGRKKVRWWTFYKAVLIMGC
mmetsp:Transcript_36933/g.42447  ORF Transcript_36933/g.42447 Transcript_36933/m.42447 type:complete len:81 (+) Transcript_36933:322-564(+)